MIEEFDDDTVIQKKIKAIIYGAPGSGKTTLLRTATTDERFDPGLIIEFEGGAKDSIGHSCRFLNSISDLGNARSGKLDVISIKCFSDFDNVYAWLVEHPNYYKFGAMDSLMEFNELGLMELAENDIKIRQSFKSIKMPLIQHYGAAKNMVDYVIDALSKDLDWHIIFTCGIVDLKDPGKNNELRSFPSVVGQKGPRKIGHRVSIVGLLKVVVDDYPEGGIKAGDRALCVGSNDSYEAKFRDEFNLVPPVIFKPTLPMILDYLEGEKHG